MANAAGGRYQAQSGAPRFPAYASAATGGGQYYPQSHQQPSGFQYYAPPPPQPPAPPGPGRFGMGGSAQQATSHHQQSTQVARNPPPPPPPPPGETLKNSNVNSYNSFASDKSSSVATSLTTSHGGYIPPLRPPPLPPMFPWMSPALAESMTSSQFGQNFREEASNLPFVPIIVNDADLAKMTENVIKEAEQVKSHQLQYYKDVINQDLPQPLKDMFQPLYCKLCTLTLSSPVVAKDHYSGKRHKKAVEAWVMKNPQLCTAKQKREAAAGGGGQGQPSPIQPTGGTFVKTPGGGIGLTGPINGYIMKHNPNENLAASTGSLQSKSTPSAPPPPSLFSLNVDNNRKRPAPSPPVIGPGAPIVNTQQQQRNNQNEFHSQSSGSQPQQKTNQFIPSTPPQQVSQQTPMKPTVLDGTGSSAPVNKGQGPTWKMPESNKSDTDFQAKRPRRDDIETPGMNVQPGAPQQPRERGGSGQGGGPPPQKMCEICNVQLSSKVMAEQHFKGKNHQAKLAALKEGGSVDAAPPLITTGGGNKNTNVVAGANTGAAEIASASANTNPKEGNSIVNKLLAISSQSIPQIPPTDLGGDDSFFGGMETDNPFQQNQPFNNSRGGGGGMMGGRGGRGNNGPPGRGGVNNGTFGRGNNGPGGGRGGGFGGRGGGNPNNNRGGGGGGGRGGGGGGGGPVFRNSSNSNNNSNNNRNNNSFNNKNRFNNSNNRGRR